MMIRGYVLAIELIATAIFAAACEWSQSKVDRALERMAAQPRYDPYEGSRFFRDGKVLQVPAEGTVAREHVIGEAELAPPVTAALLARGKSRFEIFCAVCHGAGGYGGSVVAVNMRERRPPSLRAPPASLLSDEALYRVIRDGAGRMPSYAAQLSVRDRWAVVAYVQALGRKDSATPVERRDSITAAKLRAVDSVAAIDSAAAAESTAAAR